MGIRSRKRKTKTLTTDPATPSSPRRRRLRRGCNDHLPSSPPAEWRDWAALPSDVLWVVLSRLPQADLLRGAGLACASWRRLAVDEPLLWRSIDLAAADEDEENDSPADSAPSLRRLDVTCQFDMLRRDDITEVMMKKKLPVLEQLVL